MLNPTTSRGLTTQFFQEVIRRGHARIKPGQPIAETLVVNRAKNTAYTFRNLLKDTAPDSTWNMGTDVDLEDVRSTMDDLRAGKVLPDAIKGSSINGNATMGTAGNAAETPPTSGDKSEPVGPVTPNVHQAAYRVFEALRTKAVPSPASVNDTYRMLWDALDPALKQARVSGVLADSLARLLSEDKVLFNGIFTLLPEPVQAAIEDALLDTKPETFYGSLGRTVQQVFHINKAPAGQDGYARLDFERWDAQVLNHLRYLTVDNPAGVDATDADKAEAARIHAVIALRQVEEGLRKEVAASTPAPEAPPEVLPIQFNTVLAELVAKLPAEQFPIVAAEWDNKSPAEQQQFMVDLRAEVAAAAEAPAEETSTEVVPVEEAPPPEPESTPEPPTSGSRRPNRPA